MPEKEEFTFDDQDDFPETDLSGAFEEGEQSTPVEPPEKKKKKQKGGGGGKNRPLLLGLLLVVAIGGGAYYFMGLGETIPEPAVPSKEPQKTVALPPQPNPPAAKIPAPASKPPAVQAKAGVPKTPPPQSVKVAVQPAPKPSAPVSAKDESVVTPAPKVVAAPVPPAPPKTAPVVTVKPATKPATPVVVPAPKEAPETAAVKVGKPVPVTPTAPATAVAGAGDYRLDAGAYLVTSNRQELEAKIIALGYQPAVDPVEVSLRLIRLRLGEFSSAELAEALKYVRKYAPDAFSLRKGDQHVVYAGSFLKRANIDSLKQRLTKEGIPVEEEPVEVKRTLSRVRFGSFPDMESAMAAEKVAEKAGIKVTVVNAE